MNISFLGIGLMGLPMAQNLLQQGYNLTTWNRTLQKMAPLESLGATLAPSLSAALVQADIIICMLENVEAQEAVLFNRENLTLCKKGALIIDMGSIAPQKAIAHAAQAKDLGLRYLDAPVSGGTLGAEQAQLVVMVGGCPSVLNDARHVLDAMAKEVVHIGPAGCGQVAKCANQAIVGITIGAVSEALVLAQKSGADPAAVRQALLGGFANSKILEQHGQRMLTGNFKPGGTARVQLKDLDTISELAEQQQCQLPFTELAKTQYKMLNKNPYYANLDHSALVLQLEENNQTTLRQEHPTSNKKS